MVHVDHIKLYEGRNPVKSWLVDLNEMAPSSTSANLTSTKAQARGHEPTKFDTAARQIEPETNSDPVDDDPQILTDYPRPAHPQDLEETLPYGTDSPRPAHPQDLEETLPYGTDSPQPAHPQDLEETLPYGTDTPQSAHTPIRQTAENNYPPQDTPNPIPDASAATAAAGTSANVMDDLPLAVRHTRRPRKPRDILDL